MLSLVPTRGDCFGLARSAVVTLIAPGFPVYPFLFSISKFSLVPRCPFDAAALALIGDFLNFVAPNQNQEI